MVNNINNGYKRNSLLSRLWRTVLKVKMYIVFILVLLAIIAAAYIIRSCRGNTITAYTDDKINITPTQIMSMKEIGEWEFLSVEDEEMVDTVRHGLFKDDELIRIYYGTLRLGFNMNNVADDWIKADGDTLNVMLPKISLLSNDFIDEARTKSFFETGEWSDKDRADLYSRAHTKMKARCLTLKNIESAEANASRQFYQMFRTMGFSSVKIRFER